MHFKDLSFMAHLFLTQISFAVRPFLENTSHVARNSSGVVSFLPWVSAQSPELGAGVEAS